MKLLKKTFLATAIAAMAITQSHAQITITPENDDFSLKLIGRTNIDAGTYFNRYATDHVDNGIAINDTRLGVMGSFLKNWDYKIEICFDKKAISFRDVFIKYNFNSKHHLQFGNVFMGYGLKPLGLAYKFIDDATVDNTLCPARKIGLVYLLTTDHFNFNGGVYSDGNIDNGNSKFDQGVILSAKAIYRPIIDETTVLHIGVAPMYTNSPNAATFTGVFPETFTTAGNTPRYILHDGSNGAAVSFDGTHYSRYEAELIFIQQKFLFETHYQGASFELNNNRYHVGGILAQCSYLLIGDQQNYNKKTGLCQNASPRNLEILARYDYLDLNDGGNQGDLTIGVNYFFTKHFNMKLNYGVVQEHHGDYHKTYNAVQVRAQFSF